MHSAMGACYGSACIDGGRRGSLVRLPLQAWVRLPPQANLWCVRDASSFPRVQQKLVA